MLVFIGLQESEKQYLKKHLPNALFIEDPEEIPDKKAITILSCFIKTRVNKKVLSKLPSLKFIIAQSTGYDHIDMEECKKRQIGVYNIPDYGTQTIGEYTILLILALLRKFKVFEGSLRMNVDISHIDFAGKEAFGKTLGVLGTGRIGSHVIKLANAFGMKVLAFDKHPNERLLKDGVKFVSMPELLKKSDIITLHLNLNTETYHIIDKKAMSLMKKGVFLINTARGGLVDTFALAEALEKGHVQGTALDVIEAEDLIAHEGDILKKSLGKEKIKQAFIGNMLLQRDNVIITPHIAYDTEEALRRITEITIKTLKELEKGNLNLYNRVL